MRLSLDASLPPGHTFQDARQASSSFFFRALAKSPCPRSRTSILRSFLRAAENPIFPPPRLAQATRRRRSRLPSFFLLVSRVQPRSFGAARSHVYPTRFSPAKHAFPFWLPRLRPRVCPPAIRPLPIRSFSSRLTNVPATFAQDRITYVAVGR